MKNYSRKKPRQGKAAYRTPSRIRAKTLARPKKDTYGEFRKKRPGSPDVPTKMSGVRGPDRAARRD